MSTVNIQHSDLLYSNQQELAKRGGISYCQFVVTAVAEKMSAPMTDLYVAQMADRGQRGVRARKSTE